MRNCQILFEIEEKWGEHLEMLPEEQKTHAMASILAHTIAKQQEEIHYLRMVKFPICSHTKGN